MEYIYTRRPYRICHYYASFTSNGVTKMIDEGLWLVCFNTRKGSYHAFVEIKPGLSGEEMHAYLKKETDTPEKDKLIITNMVRLGDIKDE